MMAMCRPGLHSGGLPISQAQAVQDEATAIPSVMVWVRTERGGATWPGGLLSGAGPLR
jgi:hypothetical protein